MSQYPSDLKRYGGNNYDTYGGGGGGGFYTGSQGGGGTQASPGSEAKGRGANTLRPVTIKQILETTQELADAPFKIDGVEISYITFVGRVRSVAEQTTNNTYVIDDGTGTLDVKQWVDTDAVGDGSAQQLNGQYVRVLGQLKSFSNKKHVGSHKIQLVTDFNEVQYHLLEATATHLHLTRGPPEQFAPAGDGSAVATSAYGQNRGTGDVVMGGTADAGGRLSNVSQNARIVYSTIKKDAESSEGMHVNNIRIKSHLPRDVVAKAVEELLAAGIVYTTLDEYHVAVLD
ncbi:replication factor A2 [Sphaerosporella brunnea]|uniref:Replication factor A2 n=1 Tax=Sphaerosporella brunnea TaxID=1250544 RepID=A0A5J5EZJ5_9PEZI|nr:replication factor A2 [Sphaerosporella brunnea]